MFKRVESFKQGNAIEIIFRLPSEPLGEGIEMMVGPMILDILRYAGLMRENETTDGFRSFILFRPKSSGNQSAWIEMNCSRIRSFGIEAYPIKFI